MAPHMKTASWHLCTSSFGCRFTLPIGVADPESEFSTSRSSRRFTPSAKAVGTEATDRPHLAKCTFAQLISALSDAVSIADVL